MWYGVKGRRAKRDSGPRQLEAVHVAALLTVTSIHRKQRVWLMVSESSSGNLRVAVYSHG